MSSNIDTELFKTLRTKIDVFCNTEQDEKERDWLVGYINQLIQTLAQEVEQNGVAWSIKQIDDMHFNTPTDEHFNGDKLFKGIKNSLRDRFRLETGIDPAPDYPIKAKLNQLKDSPKKLEEI